MADSVEMKADVNVEFDEASSRQQINSGESVKTLFGKIRKFLTDLKAVAFSGSYNDLSNTPTTATKDTDGLMSAEDKGKLDAFEITATGGKLHDKDIATTDLIPTSLPANGGNADTVDNKHYTDFSQNAVLLTIEQVNDPNLESGIYSAENVSMSFSSDVASNWFMLIVNKHRASAGYGTQIAIPYDNGEQRGTFYRVCHAGNWGNWIRIADENIITNENLLLNPDFRINQQGKSVYTGTTECWDKWTINAGWETARSNDDLAAIFTCITPQVNSWVVNQNIPNYKDYRGKTVTFSAQIVTASTKFSLMIYDGVDQLVIPVTTGHFSVTYRVSDSATALWCVISTNGQESLNEQIAVLSTKLELGTIATTFVPPNPSIEIAKVRASNDAYLLNTNASKNEYYTVPANVDFPVWIYQNAKRYTQYVVPANQVNTNKPDNTNEMIRCWFDGMSIYAFTGASRVHYVTDMVGGAFSAWKNIADGGNAGLLKPTLIGTAEHCTYHTILDWANSVNGMGQAVIVDGSGVPSDSPVVDEGMVTVETDNENKRKVVTFKSYGSGRGTYRRNIWSGEWRWGWQDISNAEPIKYRDITLSFNSQMSLIVPQDDMPYRLTSIDDAEHIISVIVTKCHITSPDNSIIYPYASGKNVGIKSNYANLSGTVILRAAYI